MLVQQAEGGEDIVDCIQGQQAHVSDSLLPLCQTGGGPVWTGAQACDIHTPVDDPHLDQCNAYVSVQLWLFFSE